MVNVPHDLGERIIRAARLAAATHGDMQLLESFALDMQPDLFVNGQLGQGGDTATGSVTDDKRNVPLPQLSAATSEGATLRADALAPERDGLASASGGQLRHHRHGPAPVKSRPGPFLFL
jgi:hypothetical protein